MKTILLRNSSENCHNTRIPSPSILRKKRWRIHGLLAIGIMLAAIFLFPACSSKEVGPDNTTPVASNPPSTTLPMPPLSGNSLSKMGWEMADGRRNVFSDFKGSALVLDFYATWCEPCRASVPHLIALQKKYADQGLKVIGLNVGGPDDLAEVDSFAKELNIDYVLAVPDDDLVHFLLADTSDIPQTFVFDRQGVMARRFIGFGPATADQMESAIQAALRPSTP
ncbi:MAG TPA: TlpA disulfide reductase family protein [Pyrinomonadaceae bacterium]|nr:TlpA disulfide reductase family protein [Pyrinomonadaceae bacterium]